MSEEMHTHASIDPLPWAAGWRGSPRGLARGLGSRSRPCPAPEGGGDGEVVVCDLGPLLLIDTKEFYNQTPSRKKPHHSTRIGCLHGRRSYSRVHTTPGSNERGHAHSWGHYLTQLNGTPFSTLAISLRDLSRDRFLSFFCAILCGPHQPAPVSSLSALSAHARILFTGQRQRMWRFLGRRSKFFLRVYLC